MSSVLRMLLIAISAVGGELNKSGEGDWIKREDPRGDKVKSKVAREQRQYWDILVLHWWHSRNGAGNQDMWEGGDEWQNELVTVKEEW